MKFTDKMISRGVSLPGDMWAYLELRREREGVAVSRQIRMALEREILDRATVRATALVAASAPDLGPH